jgi:superfamily II DNA or RNA helicase
MELRDYQQSAINGLRNGFRAGHKHQVLQMATGSGKTHVAAVVIKNAVKKGLRVWFVVDNLELVEQTVKVFESHGLDVGVIQAQHEKTDYRKMVQVVTAQTITRRWKILDKMREYHPGLIIIDEAHCQYRAHTEIKGMWKDNVIIGLSATPWAKGMAKMYTNLIVGATTQKLIKDGYLCDYIAYATYTPDLKKVKLLAGDYKTDSLDKEYNNKTITGGIVDTWLEKGENRQTICFAVNVAHSKSITAEFNNRGVAAAHIDGYTDKEERQEIIEDFKAGKINLLSSVGVLTKGFDCPSATCLIIARPTKSLMLHIQILGRLLRVSPCGRDGIILDHAGNISRLGFPDDDMPDTLNDDKKKDALTKKRDELKKMEKAPKACLACGHLHHEFKCPGCGKVPIVKHGVNHASGELVKIKQSIMQKRNKDTSKSDKQRFYSAALGYAAKKGFKEGWAANAYRDYVGVWPNAMQKVTGENTPEFQNFLTAKNIRYAKRKGSL